MTTTTTTKINLTVYSIDLTDEVISDADRIASAEAYCDELRSEVEAEYPEAEVTIDLQHRVTGVGSGVSVDSSEGPEVEMAVKDSVERIAERVYSAGSFWV